MFAFLAKIPHKAVVFTFIGAVAVAGATFAILQSAKYIKPRINPEQDFYSIIKGQTLVVNAENGVLENDVSQGSGENITVTLTVGTLYGNIALNNDGSFVYEPADCPTCVTDKFSYAMFSDGKFVAMATVFINYNFDETTPEAMPNVEKTPAAETPETPAAETPETPPAEPTKLTGTITIINETDRNLYFVPSTRLLSQYGTLFRMDKGMTIPSRNSINVSVTSDQTGIEAPSGITRYTIPGLSSSLQKQVYGKSGSGLTAVAVSLPPETPPETQTATESSVTPPQVTETADQAAPTAVNLPAPIAEPDSYTITEGETLVVLKSQGVLNNDADASGRSLIVSLGSVSAPVHTKTFQLSSDGSFTYAPAVGWTGTDSFSYRNRADSSQSNVAVVNIITTAKTTTGNGTASEQTAEPVQSVSVPIARDDSYDVTSGTSLGIGAYTGILLNDYDPDRYQVRVVLPVDAPAHASVFRISSNGSLLYVPADDFIGIDTFTYKIVSDRNVESAAATVRITVKELIRVVAGNNSPVQISIPPTVNTQKDVTIAVLAPGFLVHFSDADVNDTLRFVKASDPLHGTFTDFRSNGTFTYDPTAGYVGADSFTYTIEDGRGGRLGPLTANINVSPGAHPPVANDDNYAVTTGNTLVIAAPGVLANDTDPNGGPLTAVKDSEVANGTLALNSNGSFTYTPNPGFTGEEIFTYRAFDGTDYSNTAAWVTIVVNP